MPSLANIYVPLSIRYFDVFHFLAVAVFYKIVKVSQLQAFRYSIFNCFLIDFKSFVRKLDKEVDGNLCVNMPMY